MGECSMKWRVNLRWWWKYAVPSVEAPGSYLLITERVSATFMAPAAQAVKSRWVHRICCPIRRWIPLHTVCWPARKQLGHLIRCPKPLKLYQKSENHFENPCQGQQAHDKNDRDNPQNNFHFLSPHQLKTFPVSIIDRKKRPAASLKAQLVISSSTPAFI